MTLPWSFGEGTPYDRNFMKQLQDDLTALSDAIDAITTITASVNTDVWTPVLSFDTPGDLNVVYSTQTGVYYKLGFLVLAKFNIQTSTFTHSTASGNLRISGFPFTITANDIINNRLGNLQWSGITAANYTDLTPFGVAGTTTYNLHLSAQGQPGVDVTTTQATSGSTINLRAGVLYPT